MTGSVTAARADLDDAWQEWSDRRPAFRGVHLDSAAAGRMSTAVLQAVADHALREAQTGAYIAQAAATDVLTTGRADLANLLGMAPDGVAFVDSASGALRALLAAWPLPADAEVAVAPGEWGPNLQTITAHGLRVRPLQVDDGGRVDLDALGRMVAQDPPAVVLLDQVSAHRALVQPVAAAAALCSAAGVPLWVDAAQALGHVDTATGADAVFATGRKWLCGPRGVGVLGVAERWWDAMRIPSDVLAPDRPVLHRLEAPDAHVAGRVGLCTALREHLQAGPERVRQRLDEVGTRSRAALERVPGWRVLAARAGSGAITALRPTAGQDVVDVRARLLADHGILTTVSQPARAPRELSEPLLRISPHVDCSDTTLAGFASAVASLS